MKFGFAILLACHGAIHLAGFLKAFGLAELPGLGQPLSRGAGALWLAAAAGFLAAAVLLFVDARHWWVAALPAVALSQALIIADFHDAKLGTIANAIILVPLVVSLLDLRPASLRSRYDADVQAAIAASDLAPPSLVTEADLAPLPEPVRNYLRRAGAVGAPHVRSVRARFSARMRTAPDAPWMSATVEQYDFFDAAGARRLFFMEASRAGLPFVAFHRYVGDAATMEVRIAGLIPVVDARGPQMTEGETVTLFNDLCFLAPAALVDAPVQWQLLGPRAVRATYSNAGHTISAYLTFDAAGDLVGFLSDDRYQSDGKTHRRLPWSTPLSNFKNMSGVRLPVHGEARWREPDGEWTYGVFELESIAYGVGRVR